MAKQLIPMQKNIGHAYYMHKEYMFAISFALEAWPVNESALLFDGQIVSKRLHGKKIIYLEQESRSFG